VRGRLKREGQLFRASPSPDPSRGEYRAALSPQAGRGRNNEDRTRGHIPISHSPFVRHFTQPFSFPRRVSCARVLKLSLRAPLSKGGGAPRVVRVLARHPLGLHLTRQARRLRGALRPITRDARLLGALTVAILGSGAALPSPDLRPDRCELLASGS
jgi:hypothetical protein